MGKVEIPMNFIKQECSIIYTNIKSANITVQVFPLPYRTNAT